MSNCQPKNPDCFSFEGWHTGRDATKPTILQLIYSSWSSSYSITADIVRLYCAITVILVSHHMMILWTCCRRKKNALATFDLVTAPHVRVGNENIAELSFPFDECMLVSKCFMVTSHFNLYFSITVYDWDFIDMWGYVLYSCDALSE